MLKNRIITEVNLNVVCSVSIVDNSFGHVPWSNVVIRTKPLYRPPASGDTDLVGVAVRTEAHVEGTSLDSVPYILGECGYTLVVAVVAVKTEAVCAVPVYWTVAIRIVVRPDGGLHFLVFTTTINPYFFFEVDLQRGVTATREQQVLSVELFYDRIITEVNLDMVCAILVVDNALGHVPRSNVVVCAKPLYRPPACGDTNLVGVAARTVLHEEGTSLDLVPDILREGGDTLVVAVIAVKTEAVCAVPVHRTITIGIIILPDRSSHNLHVSTACIGLVSQLGQRDCLSVVGVKISHEGAFIDILLRNTEDETTCALAIEVHVVDELRNRVGIEQLHAIDELQVCTIYGDELTTRGTFTRLFRESRYNGMSNSQRQT